MDQIVTFSDTDAKALYVAALGAIFVGVTYIESSGHGIAAGCIAGGCSIAILAIIYVLIRIGNSARRSMS